MVQAAVRAQRGNHALSNGPSVEQEKFGVLEDYVLANGLTELALEPPPLSAADWKLPFLHTAEK